MNGPLPHALPVSEQGDDDSIDLAQYLDLVIDHRWLITAVAAAAIALGGAYSYIARPIYETNILVQVEDSAGSSKNILGDLASVFDVKAAATAEMEIIRSRTVITRALDNASQFVTVTPKRFPVIGNWIGRRNKNLSEPGLLGMGGYAWGIERADVESFRVPEALEGTRFTLTADGNNAFHVSHEDLDVVVKGTVGELVKAATPYGDIELKLSALAAKQGAQFYLSRKAELETVEQLQRTLAIAEKGKQSGIISVTLQGDDPVATQTLLNELGNEYIRQNVERKSEEAEKSLVFLNKQLPELKQSLEAAENRYNQLRNSRGTVDLSEEAKSVLGQSVATQSKLVELKQKREELLVRFQKDNTVVTAIDQQIRALSREMEAVESKIKRMPSVEQDVFRLTRDVKVNTDLYTTLLNTAQQLRLVKASKVGSARLLDPAAKPLKPVKPNRPIVIALAALIGLFLGVVAAFVKKSLFGGIEDPHEIEQHFGVSVSATVPQSQFQEKLYADIKNKVNKVSILAHDAPHDSAIESLRSFRTSLQFSMLSSRNNIIMMTGPTPEVGKSFVSTNFTAVLGSFGKKVLLIDADMRKGYLNQYFGLGRNNGLSELIAGTVSLEQALHSQVVENVDFISTGQLPPKPAELLAHPNFTSFLKDVASRYDLVVIDTPPVLAVSDALIIANQVGTIYCVVRAGVSVFGEIDETIKRVGQTGNAVTGIVFNGLRPRLGNYDYGYKYGKYRYRQYEYGAN